MKFKLLEVVALTQDLPEHGLVQGDRGTVVEFWKSGALEVEFLKAGQTVAVLTLEPRDLKKLAPVRA